ncbi:MAG: TonB-dependent receptor [Leptospiraceae bacterium]|nr:TonB-dependent receptor [Leptospiraceae bacterium]
MEVKPKKQKFYNSLRISYLLVVFFFSIEIFADTKQIKLDSFAPYKTPKDEVIEERIMKSLRKELEKSNLLITLQGESDSFEIKGYYTKNKDESFDFYAQIYDVKSGKLIDAVAELSNLGIPESIVLDKNESKNSFEIQLNDFVRRIRISVESNPERKEIRQNIEENLLSLPLGKEISFNTKKNDSSKTSEEIFEQLQNMSVTTVTRTKTTIKEAPAAVYVVTREQILKRGYRTLSDALHDLPGFDFQHAYGIFSEHIHQRGVVGENNRTLVYIDGIPDNNLSELAIIAGTIRFPLDNVERIEVVSGPASALYGANAFNGIINIITRDGKTSPGHHVSATYGAWESGFRNPGYAFSMSTRGSVGKDKDAIQYSAGLYYFNTVGPNMGLAHRLDKAGYDKNDPVYFAETKACGGVCNPDGKSVGYWWSPGYNNSQENTYNATAQFSRGGFRFQTVNWQYLQGEGTFGNGTQQIDVKERGLESSKFDSRNNARRLGVLNGISPKGFTGSNWDFQYNSLRAGYLHTFSPQLNSDTEFIVRTTHILSSSHEEYPNKPGPDAYYRPGDVKKDENYARPDLSYQLEHKYQYDPYKKHSVTTGAILKNFYLPKGYGTSERLNFNTYGVYGQYIYKPIGNVSITVGSRYDLNTIYGHVVTPRLSLVYNITENWTLKFLYSRGYREPSAKELFSETSQRKPNPELKSEGLVAYEAVIGYSANRFYSNLNLYYNKTTNLIYEVTTEDATPRNGTNPTGGTWQQNQNLGEIRVYASEWDNFIHITKNLTVNMNYTYTQSSYYKLPSTIPTSPSIRGREGENLEDDLYLALYKNFTGKSTTPKSGEMPSIAPHKMNLGITWSILKDLSFYTGLNFVDIRRNRSTSPLKTVPGYTMLKLNIRWENILVKGMFFQVHINNMLNEQYYDSGIRSANGVYYPTMHPLERRNIWFTLGYNF